MRTRPCVTITDYGSGKLDCARAFKLSRIKPPKQDPFENQTILKNHEQNEKQLQLRVEPGDAIDELYGKVLRNVGTKKVVAIMRMCKGCPVYMQVAKVITP